MGRSPLETLPEAQRTQDIESKTWIISKSWNECKFQFSTLSPPPLPGNHLSHLVHLPVILLAHHHLNNNNSYSLFFVFFLFWPMFSLHLSTQNVNSLVRTRSFPGQEFKQYFSPFLNLMKKSTEILLLSDTRLDANKLKFLENQFSFTEIIIMILICLYCFSEASKLFLRHLFASTFV